MNLYILLNAVKPYFLQTQYPFNFIDKNKIIFTKNKISIMVKSLNNSQKSSTKIKN